MARVLGSPIRRCAAGVAAALATVGLTACGGASRTSSAASSTTTVASTTSSSTVSTPTSTLPGAGKPPVTIGDKNFTEQFLLGQLYSQALAAQGYSVLVNQNIGPISVRLRALQSGALDMYPETLDVFNRTIAGYQRSFASQAGAYRAAQRYAAAHGLKLLAPTPFSDTTAVGVTFNYSIQNGLRSIADLQRVASALTFGGPPQFEQSSEGLPALERVYGVRPAGYKLLGYGDGYRALDQGKVQAAAVGTTDGQLITGNYTLLSDPRHVFGWGSDVPVVPLKVLRAEGPVFAQTIDRVTALLTVTAMRQLNAAVDVSGQDPKLVAERFLADHGLLAATHSS